MAKELEVKTNFWWAYLVLGILILIAGGNFLAYPFAALTAIAVFISLYMIVSGACAAVISVVDRKVVPLWGLQLVLNILVCAIGVFMIESPSFAANFMWIFCGIGFLLDGIAIVALSIGLKKLDVPSWIAPLILGIITIVASIMILCNPILGLGFIAIFVSISIICFGINMIIMSFQLKPEKK